MVGIVFKKNKLVKFFVYISKYLVNMYKKKINLRKISRNLSAPTNLFIRFCNGKERVDFTLAADFIMYILSAWCA